jgi:hypothetical protein
MATCSANVSPVREASIVVGTATTGRFAKADQARHCGRRAQSAGLKNKWNKA